jgi:hypothetical protein
MPSFKKDRIEMILSNSLLLVFRKRKELKEMKKNKPPLGAQAHVTLDVASQQDEVCFDELTKGTNSMEIATQKTDGKQISENEVPLDREKRNLQKIDDWLRIFQRLSQCLVMCFAQIAIFILLVTGLIAHLLHGDAGLLISVLALIGFTHGSKSRK